MSTNLPLLFSMFGFAGTGAEGDFLYVTLAPFSVYLGSLFNLLYQTFLLTLVHKGGRNYHSKQTN
jgi:hypothetical protein